MDESDALSAFGALSQSTRMATLRLLIQREPKGVAAGELARLVNVPQNTMSAHLAVLVRSGLIIGERHSRSIIYRARVSQLRELMTFLMDDCCGGRSDLCAPIFADERSCKTTKIKG
jgi:DNA-binding transcriptional ArsR family regulator